MELKSSWVHFPLLSDTVLIVPYGIEIQEDFEALKDEICINCTLWN